MCYFPWGTVSPKGNGPRQVPLFMALQIRYPLEWGGHVRLPRSLAVWMGRLWLISERLSVSKLRKRYILVGGLEHGFYFSIYWECHKPN
jgi:hypothetical protein